VILYFISHKGEMLRTLCRFFWHR